MSFKIKSIHHSTSVSGFTYKLENGQFYSESDLFFTEEEIVELLSEFYKDEDINITSKHCFKSELKFLQREEKLNRILKN